MTTNAATKEITETATFTDSLEFIEQNLATVRNQLAQLEAQALNVRARGTSDLTAKASDATALVAVPTEVKEKEPSGSTRIPVEIRIEKALRADVLTLKELSKAIGSTPAFVAKHLKILRKSIGNIGTMYEPRYTWKIGMKSTPEERRTLILRLVSEMPLSTAELVEATGISIPLVSAVLVHIGRSDMTAYNIGTDYRHRTFVVPNTAKPVKLAPKLAAGTSTGMQPLLPEPSESTDD